MMIRPSFASEQRGQSALEYLVICAALALAIGLGLAGDDSALSELIEAFRVAYQQFSYALSLPS
ncbi:hypothetical protein GALL_192110 [mine drainage metagenome]|uniref:Flp/Fap pilin component n=1 Tax=mine drainage metagenome TaxID=410659 RepID=A0A1J5RRV2_9ZZZZ